MSEDEIVFWDRAGNPKFEAWLKAAEAVVGEGNIPVSYTHLTLPTKA